MEIAVSLGGPDSQHLTSQDTLHLASQDLPSAYHRGRDTSPASETLNARLSPQRATTTRHGSMSSSNGILATQHANVSQTSQRSNGIPHTMSELEIEGQDHDRMETDEESDGSDSGTDTPQNEASSVSNGGADMDPSDPEAMDTTPDGPDADATQPLSNQSNLQPISQHETSLADQLFLGITTATPNGNITDPSPQIVDNGLTDGPTAPPDNGTATENHTESTQGANQQDGTHPIALAPSGAQDMNTIGQPADSSSVVLDAPPPESPPPVEPDDANRTSRPEEEEEQPYWASFEEDKSIPSEEELKRIERQPTGPDALDHGHWEKLAFESLDDPEYQPSATGRISWTLKGFHGTPSTPNRETVMRSPSVLIDGYYWNIKVYPRGNEGTPLMSVYIECSTSPDEGLAADTVGTSQAAETSKTGDRSMSSTADNQNMSSGNVANALRPTLSSTNDSNITETPQALSSKDQAQTIKRWEVPAQLLCVAYNPEEPRVLAYDRSDHRFLEESPDWGWRRFHGPWNKLHLRERFQRQALLRNDTLCFTAYIRTIKDDTGALFWHAATGKPQWDHYDRLGLNRLLAGSGGSSAAVSALSTWLHLYPLSVSIDDLEKGVEDNYRGSSLFDELDHWRHEFMSSSKDVVHETSFESAVEMVDWYDTGDCEADVVAFWETLRRILSFEATDVKTIAEARDFFKDILLLKQPDAGKQLQQTQAQGASQVGAVARSQLTEPGSVQEAIDQALTYEIKDDRVWKTFDGYNRSLAENPAILQVELHRQNYDTTLRKWKKLTHYIKLDDTVVFGSQETAQKPRYTLFGLVVHSGSLESKDYYSILRPQGPGTRWIKYAGDKAERGVECLTTKQAIAAHEGGKDADVTAAVAYIVTYVRIDLLPKLAVEPRGAGDDAKSLPEATKHQEEPSSEPMDQDDQEDMLTVHVYQSKLFEGHDNLGVFDWGERGLEDTRVIKLDVSTEITPNGIVDAIVKSRREQLPDKEETYALWFLNSLLNNAAMDSVMRAPQIIPFTDRATDEPMKMSGIFYGPLRVWLHVMPSKPDEEHQADSNMMEASAILPAPDAEESTRNDEIGPMATTAHPSESLQASNIETTSAPELATADQAENATDSSRDETPPSEAPTTEDSDTAMEGNAEVDIENIPPPPVKPTWNTHLDREALGNTDNVYVLLKFFDHDAQTLRGVKCFFATSTAKVGETLRNSLSLAKDQLLDVYEEKVSSVTRPVSTDSRFIEIAAYSSYILIAQRRPSPQELSSLKAAGKPSTVPAYYSYLLFATDPAYLRPHLTTSYFSTPYYSGTLAYGRPHGPGTSIALSGDAYTGTFRSGLKHGHGTMRYANGDTYTGAWAADEPDGEGEMVYAKTGNVYTGGFKKRKRHGKGVMRFEVADEEERLCQICYEEEMDALFFDCGHVAACESCARQVEDCPVCRRRVKAVCKIWMS